GEREWTFGQRRARARHGRLSEAFRPQELLGGVRRHDALAGEALARRTREVRARREASVASAGGEAVHRQALTAGATRETVTRVGHGVAQGLQHVEAGVLAGHAGAEREPAAARRGDGASDEAVIAHARIGAALGDRT